MTMDVYNPPRIPAVGDASDGSVIDVEARRAQKEMFDYMRQAGFMTVNALSIGATGYSEGVDHADYDITGDIELGFAGMLTDYTPGGSRTVVSKFTETGAQRSYRLMIPSGASGALRLMWSTAGTAATELTADSTVSLNTVVADANYITAKATMDVDDGGGNRVIKFWYKPYSPYTYLADLIATTGWTQLGATVTTAGTTSIFSGTAPVRAGAIFTSVAAGFWANGKISAVLIKNGLDGTVVASPDFNRTTGEASFTDSFNRTWTPQSTAVYAPA